MRQRVELARALGGETPLLLMDEPFSSLDYLTRLRMRRELARMLRERPRTVVLVTHDIEEAAQLADRVLVLSERPARVRDEVVLDMPRPARSHASRGRRGRCTGSSPSWGSNRSELGAPRTASWHQTAPIRRKTHERDVVAVRTLGRGRPRLVAVLAVAAVAVRGSGATVTTAEAAGPDARRSPSASCR